MMLSKGEKLFVITRRQFEGDLRRHFVGEVQGTTEWAVRVQGYLFVYDNVNNVYVRREGERTRIFSLVDAGLVINLLPREAVLKDVRYRADEEDHLVLTDEKSFKLDINEFGFYR
ncbi:MAG: hypothetical protein R2864_09340 [Syntrophotaleaceae bacterium]